MRTSRARGFIRAGLGLAMALGAWAGCGGRAADQAGPTGGGRASGAGAAAASRGGGPVLLFVTNTNADFWTAVEKGMRDGAAKFGAQAEMHRNEGSTHGQIRLLENALSRPDIGGVAVSVTEAQAPGLVDALQALKDAGKKVITIDSDIAPEAAGSRLAHVGTNNVRAGEAAGRATKTLRPQGGKVVAFVGYAASANARERSQGFLAAAGDDFPVVETFEDGGDKARAASNVQTAITKYRDVGVLLGLYSYNGPRIAEEISNSDTLRRQVTVVTFDLDELAVGHLEAGRIDATVVQNPYEMGYQGVRLLKALVDGDKKTVDEMLPGGAPTIDTGVRVVVPRADSPLKGDNVLTIDEMKSWLASKGLKSS